MVRARPSISPGAGALAQSEVGDALLGAQLQHRTGRAPEPDTGADMLAEWRKQARTSRPSVRANCVLVAIVQTGKELSFRACEESCMLGLSTCNTSTISVAAVGYRQRASRRDGHARLSRSPGKCASTGSPG